MKLFGTNRGTMYNTVLFGTLLCLGFGSEFVDCTVWVDDLARYVAENSEFKQVNTLTKLDKNESLENSLSGELLMKLMQNIPTIRVNYEEDFELPLNLVPNDEFGTKTPIDSSATLFLILIESHNSLPISMTKKFLDAVKEMANHQYTPKYMIVSFVRKPSKHLKGLLDYAWSKKMLDLTIVGLVQPKVPRTSILMERPVAIPRIYQFNPFKKEYTKGKWTADLNNLFPNKVKNMQKYPIIAWNPNYDNRQMKKSDPALLFADLIIQQLNSSFYVVNPMTDPSAPIMEKIEFVIRLYPFDDFGEMFNGTQATTWITIEGIRFLVPILRKPEISVATDFFVGTFLSIGVIFIVWIFTRCVGFKSYPWRPFNIGRVFFGISISHQPRGNAERIIFTCLLIIFAIYSSAIYGAITEITIQQTSEIEFNTLKDLADSDLIFHGDRVNIERASAVFGDHFKTSRDRFVEDFAVLCAHKLIKNKKISCLMQESAAISLMLMFNHSPIPMKLAKPPLVTENYGFGMRPSPYRSSIDKSIMRLHSVGLVERIFYDRIRNREAVYNQRARKQSDQTDALSKQLIAVSIVGYGLSILVFLAEIIYHRISVYRKSKIRPLPPLFPWTE